MTKIKFHLYVTSAGRSSLLIYAYRKRFGSTVVRPNDLKVYYPSYYIHPFPGKAELGSAHVSQDSAPPDCSGTVIKTLYRIILSPVQVWQIAS